MLNVGILQNLPGDVVPMATLLCLVVVSAVVDFRSHRIPNILTFPAILIGIGYFTISDGVAGLLFSLSGMTVGLGVLIIPYLFGIMGAGDVKLMAAVGALLGKDGAFSAFVWTCIAGGVLAGVMLVIHRGYALDLARSCWGTLKTFALTRQYIWVYSKKMVEKPKLPYGVAISAGTLLSLFLR